jgi:hypothetical protein
MGAAVELSLVVVCAAQEEFGPCERQCQNPMMQVRRNEPHRRITIFGLGILILTATLLCGQENAVTILGGQGMHTALETEIGSLTSHPGDKFVMRLLDPVVVDNREVLPKGTVFQGKVLTVLAADPKTHTAAEVGSAFDKVVLPDGRSFPVNASAEEQRRTEFDTRLSAMGMFWGAYAVRWEDFRWKKCRTGWLRLRFDLEVPAAFVSGKPAPANPDKR